MRYIQHRELNYASALQRKLYFHRITIIDITMVERTFRNILLMDTLVDFLRLCNINVLHCDLEFSV